MCNCSSSSCGCSTVSGRRGPRGLAGPAGVAGTSAQVLSGDGAPTVDPTPVTAYALYEDTATGGHWWIWTPGTPGSWADTGAPVSGADGTDGLNAFSLTTAATTIPAAGGFMLATVAAGENTWMVPGQVVYVQTAGYFQVLNLVGTTQVALINLRNNTTGAYASNAVSGPLVVGSEISPGGLQGPAGLSISVTSGSGAPSGDLDQEPGLYLRTGGNYYLWDIGGQSWTDTGISVTGPAGATGATGAAGYSPVTTTGTGAPAGGNNGDIYFRQQNPGLLQVYTKAAGVWSAGITITSNRLLGYSNSNPTPNPSSLAANAGDQWWTQIGTQVTMWVYNGSSWAVAITFSTSGGGGGGSDLPTTIAATTGQLSGTLPVNWQRTNFNVARNVVTVSPGATIQFDTNYAYHDLSILHASPTLNYTDPPSGYYSEWVFMLTNTLATQVNINYTANQWKVPSGVSQPLLLNASGTGGDVAILHCYFLKGFMWISKVDINPTII